MAISATSTTFRSIDGTAIATVIITIALGAISCSDEEGGASAGGLAAPCTDSSDCAAGLSCKYDICMEVASADAMTFEASDTPPDGAPESVSRGSPFGISFEEDQITIVSNSIRFVNDFTGEDVTPNWIAAVFLGWSGADATGDRVSVMLIVPETSGTLDMPGPRALHLVLDYQSSAPIELPATSEWVSPGSEDHAEVVYVDTDDQTASEDGWNLPWADVGGTVLLESIDGVVTGHGPDYMDDTGWVEATINLDDLTLTDLEGNNLEVSGSLHVRGNTDPDAPAGIAGTGGSGSLDGSGGAVGDPLYSGGSGGTGGNTADPQSSGGTSAASSMQYGVAEQSCLGATETCNSNGEPLSCCHADPVDGSEFYMGRCDIGPSTEFPGCEDYFDGGNPDEIPDHYTHVSGFVLDTFEVTVGRFRRFVEAYDGTAPPIGAGAHPRIDSSGWDSVWDAQLPEDRAELVSRLNCSPESDLYQTWTDTAQGREQYPIDCVDWYTAFAFCAWDGGRLPTEAEWELAAAGGSENRLYPWGNASPEQRASYALLPTDSSVAVGSYPEGRALWGHQDMAGNVYEWVLDGFQPDWYEQSEVQGCDDCANLSGGGGRVVRGGSWTSDAPQLRTAFRLGAPAEYGPGGHIEHGIRCARDE